MNDHFVLYLSIKHGFSLVFGFYFQSLSCHITLCMSDFPLVNLYFVIRMLSVILVMCEKRSHTYTDMHTKIHTDAH